MPLDSHESNAETDVETKFLGLATHFVDRTDLTHGYHAMSNSHATDRNEVVEWDPMLVYILTVLLRVVPLRSSSYIAMYEKFDFDTPPLLNIAQQNI